MTRYKDKSVKLEKGQTVKWHDGVQWNTGHVVKTAQNFIVHSLDLTLVTSYGELYLVDPTLLSWTIPESDQDIEDKPVRVVCGDTERQSTVHESGTHIRPQTSGRTCVSDSL